MSKLFAVGDFVRLTIGGKIMVIVQSDILRADHWICSWVDSDGLMQMSSIDQDLLKYVGLDNLETQTRS